jgi:hypothetical protein
MSAQVRTVPILPPSKRAELTGILRVSMLIVVGVWMALARSMPAGGSDAPPLLPYQAYAFDLPSADQRMFRDLAEGVLEAERVRSTEGRWPETARLASEGIPPFFRDPTVKGPQYSWTLSQEGTVVNYLGVPDQPFARAWLILILEPEPGAPPDPSPNDEEHHRLINDVLLHVTVWSHPNGPTPVMKGLIPVPPAEGWTQHLGRAAAPPAVATQATQMP